MTTPEMMILIFGMFFLVPAGLFSLVVSVGNFLYGDPLVGAVSLMVSCGCALGVYYLAKKFGE